MIKEIEIKNFQSHVYSKIQLHPGVNVITGSTDSGKSSVIRASKWLIQNRLKKGIKLYRSHLAGKSEPMSVTMTFSDGTKIERHSSTAMNAYIIHPHEPLKAIRSEVPQEVFTALRMNEINIEEQHDPYFLLDDSPGQVASKFNEVIKLEAMDEVMSMANTDIDTTKKELVKAEQSAKEKLKQIEELDWISEASGRMEDLDFYMKIKTDLETKIPEISSILERINILESDISVCKAVLELDTILTEIEQTNSKILQLEKLLKTIEVLQNDLQQFDVLSEIEENYNELKSKNIKYKLLRSDIENLEGFLFKYSSLKNDLNILKKFDSIEDPLKNLENLQVKILSLKSKIIKLENNLASILESQDRIEYLKDSVLEMEEKLHKIIGQYEICPLCGRQIDD